MSRFNSGLIIAALLLVSCSGQPAPNATQIANPTAQPATATAAQTATAQSVAEQEPTEPAATSTPVPATATLLVAQATVAPTDTPVPATPAPTATLAAPTASVPTQVPATCTPTQEDMLGPFYVPGAPVRDTVGQGYVLSGVVRSAVECQPLPGAQIEFWLAGPDGQYDDAFRATEFAGEGGTYRFSSHAPPPYSGRPPHIHIRVTAPGHQTLVTQHYPGQAATSANVDLVLSPSQ